MSNLKQKRESAGFSQSQLSKASDVNVRIIQDYEQGRRDINKAESFTVYKLSKALNCTMEDLIEFEQ